MKKTPKYKDYMYSDGIIKIEAEASSEDSFISESDVIEIKGLDNRDGLYKVMSKNGIEYTLERING